MFIRKFQVSVCTFVALNLIIVQVSADDVCENQEDGAFLAHPADCSSFLMCNQGRTETIQSCPVGFHFNRQLKICDYKARAGCDSNFALTRQEYTASNCCCCCFTSNCQDKGKEPECPTTTETPTITTESPTVSTSGMETPTAPITIETDPTATETDSTTTSDIETPTVPTVTEYDSTTASDIETPTIPTATETVSTTTSDIETPTIPTVTESDSTTTSDIETPKISTVTETDSTTTSDIETPTIPTVTEPDSTTTSDIETPTIPTVTESDSTTTPDIETPTIPTVTETDSTTTSDIETPTIPTVTEPDSTTTSDIETPTIPTVTESDSTTTPDIETPTIPTVTESDSTTTSDIETPTIPTVTESDSTTTSDIETPTIPTVTESHSTAEIDNHTITVISTVTEPASTVSTESATSSHNMNQDLPYYCLYNLTECINKPDGDFLKYPGDCSKYIVCVGGCAEVMNCPSNLYFNLNTTTCDYRQNVVCESSDTRTELVGPSGTSCDNPGACVGKPEGALLPDPTSNGYLVCQCECEVKMPCPAGLVFNATAEVCDWPVRGSRSQFFKNDDMFYNTNNVSTSCGDGSLSAICDNHNESILLPVEGMCNKLYICSNGCAYEIECPDNLIFNSTAQFCDYPENVACACPYRPEFGPSVGPLGIACDNGGHCTDQAEGTLLPSTQSPNKYIVCQCGCEVEMNCPKGLNFDSYHKICTFPETLSDQHSIS